MIGSYAEVTRLPRSAEHSLAHGDPESSPDSSAATLRTEEIPRPDENLESTPDNILPVHINETIPRRAHDQEAVPDDKPPTTIIYSNGRV